MTSAISAIIFGRGARARSFTEEDWTDEQASVEARPQNTVKAGVRTLPGLQRRLKSRARNTRFFRFGGERDPPTCSVMIRPENIAQC